MTYVKCIFKLEIVHPFKYLFVYLCISEIYFRKILREITSIFEFY